MPVTSYDYLSKVNLPRGLSKRIFLEEINSRLSSGQVTDVAYVTGGTFDVTTNATLDSGDQQILDEYVKIHGVPTRQKCMCVSTVANLPPSAIEGEYGFATDGRKQGETANNGTGVPVYFSNGSWRVYSDDSVVQA